ncbi:AbrB/MazE/SpoVT family DNA-binding domain-containing protein [Lentibacillus sp. Marseille-P4043]|uniref:AbrB/MazE/SpoVT family DNA-binding domain-containing protein n=1 Tax=Lentibacillus sp. Marseille-P4043 TaxID=2040293 RepID=UPI000D0BA57B|nr:AbrB/MazE/SpoVT family DNA-binding domain-containing protein [Lentibacillus sp. Marseille-P4043]
METNNHSGVYKMTVTAQKWGNSIGIRIPFRLADKYGIVKGTELDIRDTKNGIELTPKEKPTLDDLLAQCDGENPYEEFFSEPIGKEEL